jgi:hypothetical protein
MPRSRRLQKRRLDVLSLNERGHLETGFYFWGHFPGEVEFESEAHRQAAWTRHREMILAEYDRAGHRPVALWEYDFGDWSQFGESESDAVYQLIKAGRLTEIRRDGARAIDSEIEAIEADWLREIAAEVACRAGRETIDEPLGTYGTPAWFYNIHAPRLLAAASAGREKFAAQIGGRDDAGQAQVCEV